MNNFQKSNNWFLDQLTTYQVANSDSQSIKNNFIVRKTEYSIIIDSIQNKKANDPLQHELILGRRGSGKSTLLKRIEVEIVENPKLNKKYIPIYLAEEQAGIYRLFDLWEQVLEELKLQTKIEISIQEYASFKDNHDYTRYLYNLINETCTKCKKKIILLLDNFDRIVGNFDDDGSLLRETLINYNDIQLIAGSTSMDEHFWKYDMPFYEFFRRHRLEALSREEINLLLNHWSDSLDILELKDFVKNNPGKIENIRILTDGLPRTLQFFIQIVLQKSETTTYEYLKKTMDNVSPLFQERLNALPAQLRKTILEMSFIWEACTTKQLVEKARMESKLISANLNTLVEKGLVDKIETNKKQHLYRLSERFFNMWLIVTQGNPDQKRKAKWLSIFLENWYDAGDLKQLANEHILKLQKGETDWDHALVFSKALSQNKYISLAERDTIIELTEKLNCEGLKNCFIEMPEKYSDILKKINKYVEDKNYQKAIEITENIENESDGIKYALLGRLYVLQKKYTEAEKYLLMSLKNGVTEICKILALLYKKQKKYTQAEKYFLMAIEEGNTDLLYDLAQLYYIQEKYLEAEKYYLMAIENRNTNALNNLAVLYDKQEKYLEAKKYNLMAIEKGDAKALNNMAILYYKQEKYSEAEKYYLMAIKKGVTGANYNLALLYHKQEKYSEAEKYYLMAVEKGELKALNNIAILYSGQKKYAEAEKYYLMAIENRVSETHFNLALLYQNQEKYTEAEKYYLMAIEKGDYDALINLAILYYQTNSNKAKAFEYINQACSLSNEPDFKETKLIIEFWNGIFNDVENRMISIAKEKNGEDMEEFIIDLLVQQQKTLVLKLFQNEELGSMLQKRYMVLYYVTLLLNNLQDENLRLRIPPELQSTIDEVLRKIETQQQLYSSNRSLF